MVRKITISPEKNPKLDPLKKQGYKFIQTEVIDKYGNPQTRIIGKREGSTIEGGTGNSIQRKTEYGGNVVTLKKDTQPSITLEPSTQDKVNPPSRPGPYTPKYKANDLLRAQGESIIYQATIDTQTQRKGKETAFNIGLGNTPGTPGGFLSLDRNIKKDFGNKLDKADKVLKESDISVTSIFNPFGVTQVKERNVFTDIETNTRNYIIQNPGKLSLQFSGGTLGGSVGSSLIAKGGAVKVGTVIFSSLGAGAYSFKTTGDIIKSDDRLKTITEKGIDIISYGVGAGYGRKIYLESTQGREFANLETIKNKDVKTLTKEGAYTKQELQQLYGGKGARAYDKAYTDFKKSISADNRPTFEYRGLTKIPTNTIKEAQVQLQPKSSIYRSVMATQQNQPQKSVSNIQEALIKTYGGTEKISGQAGDLYVKIKPNSFQYKLGEFDLAREPGFESVPTVDRPGIDYPIPKPSIAPRIRIRKLGDNIFNLFDKKASGVVGVLQSGGQSTNFKNLGGASFTPKGLEYGNSIKGFEGSTISGFVPITGDKPAIGFGIFVNPFNKDNLLNPMDIRELPIVGTGTRIKPSVDNEIKPSVDLLTPSVLVEPTISRTISGLKLDTGLKQELKSVQVSQLEPPQTIQRTRLTPTITSISRLPKQKDNNKFIPFVPGLPHIDLSRGKKKGGGF